MNFEFLIKIIFENYSLIGIFFIIAGLIKIFVYYKLFGIYIFEYLDIKEVITLFFNNLLAFFILIFIFFAIDLGYTYHSEYSYILTLCTTIGTVIYYVSRNNVYAYEVLAINTLIWLFYIFSDKFYKIVIIPESDILKNYVLIGLLFILIFCSLINCISEYHKVKHLNYYNNILIKFKDFTFNSSNTRFYIGKTDKFIFIYNDVDKSSEVYPVTEILKIIIKKRFVFKKP